MKVLIVDDSSGTRSLIRVMLEKRGWQVLEAADGHAACELIEGNDIRIVITDWMMPGMDGLSLIEWIRDRDRNNYIYSMLMTSRDQQEDRVEGFSVGADDYITKPVAADILHARLGVAKRILNIQEELQTQQLRLRESRDLVARAYETVQEDLENAAAVQRSQLPGNSLLSQCISSAWCYRPAMGISGDYLDVFQVGEDRLFFYLLDVSGHGVTAALRSSAISQLLRPISGIMDGLIEHGPSHVMSKLNRHLCEGNRDIDYFATLVMGEIDAAKGLLRLSSAGHPPPLILKEGTGARQIGIGGLPLGIQADTIYDQETLFLESSDALLLYSDGLLECQDRQGFHYGLEPLKRNFENNCGPDVVGTLSKIETGLDEWRGAVPLSDDLSLLLLRYSPATLHATPETKSDMTLCPGH